MKRILIFGFPRSGTTLLQSLIGSHPDILTFPETHIVSKTLWPVHLIKNFCIRRRLSESLVKEFMKNSRFYKQLDARCLEEFKKFDTRRICRSEVLARITIDFLDKITLAEKKTAWLEKTPDHLLWWKSFQSATQNIYFIHIQRSPEAAIASFYAAAQSWVGAPKTLKKISRKWNRSISASLSCAFLPNHFHITYDSLLKHPHLISQKIVQNIGLPASSGFTKNFNKVAKDIITSDETHKARNREAITKGPSKYLALSLRDKKIIQENIHRSLYEEFKRIQSTEILSD